MDKLGRTRQVIRADIAALRAGDSEAFVKAVAVRTQILFEAVGSSIAFPHDASHVAREGGTPAAGLLAAAMDLRALLSECPQGRQALRDLGFEPVFHDAEGE